MVGGILTVDPGAAEFLVIGRYNDAAGVAGLPADDLVRMAALLAPLLQAGRPTSVGRHGFPLFRIPEQSSAFPITENAHIDGRERSRAQLGGAESFSLAIADALQEIFPQRLGVVARQAARDEFPFHI